eukprot:552092_1
MGRTKQSEIKPSQLEAFLSKLGLKQYLAVFTKEGFETMDQLQDIDHALLKEIGISKMAHRLTILKGIRSYNAQETTHNYKEEHKENDEEMEEDDVDRKNALIVCVGVAEYDEFENLDAANDIAMYRALFGDKYHYKVLANDPSKRMNRKDIEDFLYQARNELYDFKCRTLNYDSLVVTFGGHGTYGSIICSDGTRFKHKDLRKIFLIDELTDIPKIFLIDACRTDDDNDDQSLKGNDS